MYVQLRYFCNASRVDIQPDPKKTERKRFLVFLISIYPDIYCNYWTIPRYFFLAPVRYKTGARYMRLDH